MMSSPVVVLLLSLVVAAAMIGTADGQACEAPFTHEGYIIDTLCWEMPGHVAADGAVMDVNPEDHTRKCLLMPPCIQSGYTLLEQGADGMYFPLYTLDAESNAMAVAFFEGETKENGYKVVTEGFACDDGTVTLSTIALADDDEGMHEGHDEGHDEGMHEGHDEGMDESMDEDMDADEPEGDDTSPAYTTSIAGHGLVILGVLVNYLLL